MERWASHRSLFFRLRSHRPAAYRNSHSDAGTERAWVIPFVMGDRHLLEGIFPEDFPPFAEVVLFDARGSRFFGPGVILIPRSRTQLMRSGMCLVLISVLLASFAPASARATCQAAIIGNLLVHDKSTGATVADPMPLPVGDTVDGIQNGSVAPPLGGYPLAGEGVMERIADLLIYDATGASGAGFCLAAGNVITVRFTGVLSSPAQGSFLSPAYLDVYDSNGPAGLSIVSATVSLAYAANQAVSYLTIKVGRAGTSAGIASPLTVLYGNSGGATGSALRVKNLRIDASSVSGNSSTPVDVSVSQGGTTVPVSLGLGGPVQTAVGLKMVTIGNLQSPKIPASNDIGSGVQGSGQGLRGGVQGLSFVPGFARAFRVRGGTCQIDATTGPGTCVSQVAHDVATVATSLIFAVTGIPSGVTVTFPARIDTTAANGAAGAMVWTARSGSTLTNSGSPGSLTVVYDTTSVGTAPGVQQIETADFADSGTDTNSGMNPNCASPNSGSSCDSHPKIGVMIGRLSGSGTAQLTVAFGPGDTPMFQGDDVASAPLARYLGSSSPTGGTWPAGGNSNTIFTRYIVPSRDFFLVMATRTTLLFPFVSTAGGFNSGLSIANACQDALGSVSNSVYGTFENSVCNQTGAVTFYFFGVDPTPGANNAPVQTSLSTDVTTGGISVASVCRGFDATGRLAPGRVAGCSLASLLPLLAGAPRGFEGYIIAIAGFSNGHGQTAQFNAAGFPYAAYPALVMENLARPNSHETLGH